MKKSSIFFSLVMAILVTSLFWIMALDFQQKEIRNLNLLVEEQYETIYKQKREINSAWKRGNRWIFEANRRGRG